MTPPLLPSASAPPEAHFLTNLALLWLAGVGLRITILAVPPVIPLINADIAMTETQVGILSGLPPVLFACAAIPGSLLIARFGAVRTLVTGLVATALGSALRGIAPDLLLLYAATIVTGFGVAIMQPSLPPLVHAWTPGRIGLGSAVFTNGLLVGEIIPVAFTLPILLPLLGGSWRLGFIAWAVPIVAIALIIVALAPRSVAPASTRRRWWPDWRDPLVWRLGLMFGSVNAMYFSANAFIPDYFIHTGKREAISAALTALNVGQLPASLLLLPYADRLLRRGWPYIVCGVVSFGATIGIAFGNATFAIAAAALLGFAAASVLVLIFALPPLLSAPDDVHRVTAAMMTISYSCAVIVPIISGLAWDTTGVAASAFAPIALIAFLLIALGPTIGERRTDRAV
ncbi:MAG: MFS transporter [Proteobacteria bacterium]|nr:MFS transporter [Pseudomonadota bacterium]